MTGIDSGLPRVRTHTLLRERGGTTGVAQTLHEALLDAGADAVFSYEVDDSQSGVRADMEVSPVATGAWSVADGPALLHLHSSGDWQSCLRGALFAGVRTLLTLHDCRALTGGCPYPLRCREWKNECTAQCPRGFEKADEVCAERRELLRKLRPVLVAPSRWMATMAREVLPDLEVRVIPNGIPWPDRVPSKARGKAQLGIPPETKLVLFAAHGGVEASYKRGWQWIESFQRIKARVPEAQCFIAGGGHYEKRDDGVTLWPYVDKRTMLGFMSASDVLMYPSQADNHPLTILEAMSQGLAVAAFGAGGIPEQLADPQAGICIMDSTWAALEKEVCRLLSSAGGARRMGEYAFEFGRKRFVAERMSSDYLKLYRRLGA